MSWFKNVYNMLLKGFNYIIDLAGADFFAGIAFIAIVLFSVVGVVFVLCSKDSRTCRKIIKISRIMHKNKKKKRPDFTEKFHKIMMKGKDRVKESYLSYLSDKRIKIESVFNNPRLFVSTSAKHSVVEKMGYLTAVILFVLTIGIMGKAGAIGNLLTLLFEAAAWPILIAIVTFIYSIFYRRSTASIRKDCIVLSKYIEDRITTYFVGDEEKVAALKQPYIAKLKKENLESFGDEREFADDLEINTLAQEVDEVKKISQDFLEEQVKLIKQKEELEEVFNREKETMEERDAKLEADIQKNKEDLLELRSQIKENDNKDVVDSLVEQEEKQIKLIAALEKLKASQKQHYIESEAKLQTEMVKIEEALSKKRKVAEEKMKADLNNFADNLIKEKEKELSEKKAELEKDLKSGENKASKKRKNINEALTDLLAAMNKHQDESGNKDPKKK